MELLLDIFICVSFLLTSFGIGYIVGCWKMVEDYDSKEVDIHLKHKQEISRLKQKLDGEEWKNK